MKKTLTINLGGTVFHIDEDAYYLLDKYLSNLKYHFKKEEGAEEIVNDIEQRISELFMEKITSNYQVITIEDVEAVITRVGKPEELSGDNSQSYSGNPQQTYTGFQSGTEYTSRKLYRDPDDKILGGIAGGFAAYMDWDPTIVRLILFLLFLLSQGTLTILYIIGWIFIPQANTAAEKLSMRGKKVTVENIGKTVTDGFQKMSDGINDYVNSGKPRSALEKLGDVFVQIIGVMFKVFLVILAVICAPVLFLLAICFIVLIFIAVVMAIGGGTALYNLIPSVDWSIVSSAPVATVVFSITGILAVGIPLIAIIYTIFSLLFNWKPMTPGMKWILLILWVFSMVVSAVLFRHMDFVFPEYYIRPIAGLL